MDKFSHQLFIIQPWILTTFRKELLENIVGKGEHAGYQYFSFSHNVFYSIKDINHHFSKIWIVVCKCFEFGLVKKFVVWWGANSLPNNKILDQSKLKAFADDQINVT